MKQLSMGQSKLVRSCSTLFRTQARHALWRQGIRYGSRPTMLSKGMWQFTQLKGSKSSHWSTMLYSRSVSGCSVGCSWIITSSGAMTLCR